jgi:alanine-synthesizing transaminase
MKPHTVQPAVRTANITYAIRDIVVLAEQVAATGREMLYLNIGDPNMYDFRTPEHVVSAVTEAMQANHCGYAPSSGVAPALQAIRAEAERKGIGEIQDIFITTGASEAIETCLAALVNHGDNILVPTPGYPLYGAVLSKLEAFENPYYLDEANGWQPDLADIAAKINEKTKGIVVINPNNPTGSVACRETLQGIIDLADERGLVVFSDEIYDKLIFDGREHVPLASLSGDVPVVTFNGLSKAYLAPGFRIGWGIVSGPADGMEDYIEAINKMLRARLCAHQPGQWAIPTALEGDQTHLAEAIAKLTRRRDLTVEMLNAIDGISCVSPAGAFYAFPRLDIDKPDAQFAAELVRETGVVIVPGSGFGQAPGTQHFRVVFLPDEQTLEHAYRSISEFLAKFRAG